MRRAYGGRRLGAVLAGIGMAVGSGASGAAADGRPAPDPTFALMVTPTRLVIEPTELDDVQHFRVVNKGSKPMRVVVKKTNFVVNRRGVVVLKPDAPYSAASWTDVSPAHFRLRPHSEKQVSVRISPPDVREPGEHQVALVFLVPAVPGRHNLRVNRAIGTPLYISVPGPVDPSLEVEGLQAKSLSLGGPVDFTVTVHSAGTVHRDLFGKDRLNIEVGRRTVALPDFTVPRGATRTITARWDDPPLMCACRAVLAVSGPHGISRKVVTVVVFPLHLAAGVVLLIVAAVFLYGWRRKRRQMAGSDRPGWPSSGEVGSPVS